MIAPGHDGLATLVAGGLAARPDADALIDGNVRVSYRELAGIVEDIGTRCRAVVGAGEGLVALEMSRSWRSAAAAFALVACGLAFATIDPSLGAERRRTMLDALGAVPVLRWEPGGSPRIDTQRVERGAPAPCSVPGRELAYVVFTSGSTGVPKATAIERRNLATLVRWHLGAYGDPRGWVAAQTASASFDVYVWDVFGTLCGGAALRIVHDEDFDPYTLWRVLAEVDVAMVPTPLVHMLLAEEDMQPERMRLRDLLTGGDRLSMHPRRPRTYRLNDNYGPTECTVVAASTVAHGDVAAVGIGSVGTALPGQRILIVDDALCPVPDGELGELLIAGSLVGRGYLNDPAGTARAFHEDLPHLAPGTRAYRTGDIASIQDGTVAFHGRRDGQVKVRGYRIELGEVEVAIVACEAVVDAVVGVVEGNGGKELVAVVLPRNEARVDVAALRAELAERLPPYMIPYRIDIVTSVPLTVSGKIDRRRTIEMFS